MKVLMFGWEFPPHILGGLGTASYGLTKGMSQQEDMEITFCIPKPWGDEDQSFLRIIGMNSTPIVWRDVDWEYVKGRVGSYMDPQLYFDLRDHIYADFNYLNANDLGCIEFSGRYPDNLHEEINNYSIVAGVIARQQEFEIIHSHDWLTYPAGIHAKQVSGKPLVIHVHATDFDRSRGNVNGEHKTLSIHEGDTVILSATPVPGNEKAVQQVVNSLAKLGCDVWDKNRALVHVSGHGSQEELKLLMAMAKPTYFMPVHGEAVHLRAHAQLARKMGIKDDHIFILDNGDTLEMRGGIVKRGTPVESGVVYVDGLRIGDTDPIVLRDRQKLANDGMVTAVAIVSLKHKKIEAIEFSGRGVSFAIDDQFSEDASASIMKTIEKGKFSFTSSGSDAIRKAVRDSLSNFIWSRTRTRPMIIPVVMEV